MGALDYLNDRSDPRVIAALERTCSICKAQPDNDCRNPWVPDTPLHRIVHAARAQAWMDER